MLIGRAPFRHEAEPGHFWCNPTPARGVQRPMADEGRSLTRLGFQELSKASSGLWGFQRAIATRAFRASGPGALPARVLHDKIASGVYAGLGGATGLIGAVADGLLGGRRLDDGRALSSSPRGALLIGAVTGLIGDTLEREGNDLAERMSVRL